MTALPRIPDPAGWVRHLRREHAKAERPVAHCRKDHQNWPCDTIKALDMAVAAERERCADLVTREAAIFEGDSAALLYDVADLLRGEQS